MNWREQYKATAKRHRWWHAEMARRIAVPEGTFRNWMRAKGDRGEPSITEAVLIAEVMGLSLDEVFRGIAPREAAHSAAVAFLQQIEQALEERHRGGRSRASETG